MEHKNELGRIYGSRISNSGKYLNLIVAATINGEEVKITCPVSIEAKEKGAYATFIDTSAKCAGVSVPLFTDAKQPKPEAKADEGEKKPLFQQGEPQDDLPF